MFKDKDIDKRKDVPKEEVSMGTVPEKLIWYFLYILKPDQNSEERFEEKPQIII